MNEDTQFNWIVGLGLGFVALVLFLILKPFGFVPVGYRGIATQMGTPTGNIRSEGFFFKVPLIQGNKNMEVRVQKKEVEASAASKDLQSVTSKIAVNFAIDPTRVIDLYREVGDNYDDRIISPALQESIKSTTAKFTAEELITKRGEVSDTILADLRTRIGQYGLIASDLNILDFDYSKSFNESIERKVTAQQDALAAENKLKQIEFEAQQAVASAKGKAEAQRIEGEALRANPEVLDIRAIERWNGVLPTYMTSGSTMPFLNIK
jgi:regulator of protease activity HflC (stomatin/prohibitin superfamily)